jgi:hypothetical protein
MPTGYPIGGHDVDTVLNQLRRQGRRHVRPFQHQVSDPGIRAPQGLQLGVCLPPCRLLSPNPPDDLLQSVSQSDPAKRRSKDQVTNLHVELLEA